MLVPEGGRGDYFSGHNRPLLPMSIDSIVSAGLALKENPNPGKVDGGPEILAAYVPGLDKVDW